MKNIHSFSFLIIIIYLISAVNPAFSEDIAQITEQLPAQLDSKYGFSLGFQKGIVYGQAFELVYPSNTKGKYLSELTWDMKPVFYAGLEADFNRVDLMSKPGFFAHAAFKLGIPGDTGVMENRDWMSYKNGNLTHFSSHTNKTKEYYWADIMIGASIPVKNIFYIKPFLSGSWMHFSFSGRDGYRTYARPNGSGDYFSIDDDPVYGVFSGEVIRYKQDWLLAAAGFSFGSNKQLPFLFEFFFSISPFTYCVGIDQHLDPSKIITFADYSFWGLYIEPKIKIGYTKNNIGFLFEAAYRYIGDTRGLSYIDIGNTGYFYQDGNAGAGLSLFDIRLIVKYTF